MASTTSESSTLVSLAEAEEALRQLDKGQFNELKSFGKPPLACLAIFEGIGILLDPSKDVWEWTDDKKLMAGSKDQFLERLFQFDKNNINDKQLEKVKSILDRDDCQPTQLARISAVCDKLGLWLRAILAYATQRQKSSSYISDAYGKEKELSFIRYSVFRFLYSYSTEPKKMTRGRGTSRGSFRGRGRGRGGVSAGRGRGRGGSAGRGRGRGRGRFLPRGANARFQTPQPMDSDQGIASTNPLTNLDINTDSKTFFVNAGVTIDQHIQAQMTNLPRYLATLFTLEENSVEIGQKAKACALAAAWCRHDHQLANNLLRHRRLFTLTEVLKAVSMLDAARQIRVYEKRLKRLELSKTKPNTNKLGKIKNNIDNLNKLKPTNGSASGAVARHIQRWTRTLTTKELEYFALHMPTEPWKKLADIVHFNPSKDFPALPWFLPFCFGKPAPEETMVARCRDLTSANVNDLIKEFQIPYSHLKQFKEHLNDASKARVATYEGKLDTILWYYEDLQCTAVDDIIAERLKNGEQITLPYGKLMERLLLLHSIQETRSVQAVLRGGFRRPRRGRGGSSEGAAGQQSTQTNMASFYAALLLIAEAQLQKIQLPLESPVAVLGDASGSMEVAIRTATILSSLLTAICSAKLNFFNTAMFPPQFSPKSIEDVLKLALTTSASGGTANAAGLVPYYESKEVIKTFVMVTDEEENVDAQLADGTSTRFFDLFMKYRAEVYPAKLVFISFVPRQHDQGQMYSQFQSANIPDVIQFKFSGQRPDLTKLDNLLGLLSTGASTSFDDRVKQLEEQLQQNGVESILNALLHKEEENAALMETEVARTTSN